MKHHFLSVYALTQYIQLKFDKDRYMKDVPLKAEIAEIQEKKGTYYLKLKDEQALISAVIFAAYATEIVSTLSKGMEVEVHGDISIYPKIGNYQLYIHKIEIAGVGEQHRNFEKLKQTLEAQGFFDPSHKKQLPAMPRRIGFVTAAKSAALQDMIATLQYRFPLSRYQVFATSVQGHKAVSEIVEQLQIADQSGVDVIVLARGGGSYEDLQSFNSELVAKTIFEMKTPIVTGIGHEIDTTISDLVSDVRAATPTAAIELVTPDKYYFYQLVAKLQQRLQQQIQRAVEHRRQQTAGIEQRLRKRSPEIILRHEQHMLSAYRQRLTSFVLKEQAFSEKQQQVRTIRQRYIHAVAQIFDQYEATMTTKMSVLKSLSPYNVLRRGYGFIEQNETIVTSVKDVVREKPLTVQLYDGNMKCEIKEIVYDKTSENI